jgi:hypothetical protein
MAQRTLWLSLLVLASAFIAIPAHADDVLTYQMTGSVTIVGYNLCSGPCEETFDFSSVLTLTPVAGEPGLYLDRSSSDVFSAYGALGDFSCCGGGVDTTAAGEDWVGFFPGPDEIDMYLTNVDSGESYLPNVNPITFAGGVELYTCASTACILDFCDDMAPCCATTGSSLGCFGAPAEGVATINDEFTLRPVVPEPGTLALALTGILTLGLFTLCRNKLRRDPPLLRRRRHVYA